MGSDSKSSSSTTTETNNLALDRSSTMRDGQQILDSIVVDPSDDVLKDTIASHEAAFEVLTKNSTFQLDELLDMGSDILDLADRSQIRLEGQAYAQLREGMKMLEAERKQGKYLIDLTDEIQSNTFDLAGEVASGNDRRLEQALGIVANVKDADPVQAAASMAFLMTVLALGAIYLTTKD